MAFHRAAMALTAVLMAVGVAGAKPPGPTADPRVNGQELSPIEREFHEGDIIRISHFRLVESDKSTKPLPIADWMNWLKFRLDHGLTMPLGTVEVWD